MLAVLFCGCLSLTLAQSEIKTPRDQTDDVIRINTDLIQTGVAVFDKKGQFVHNLNREDFELSVNGKPVSISIFEPSANRSIGSNEAERPRIESGTTATAAAPSPAARNILFVVDDIHLSHESHNRVRKSILKFIDEEMMADDTVAIVSSTGKIGFLQQFTNDKMVLRAAAGRLLYNRDWSGNDKTPPPMTEYEALLISQLDRQVTDIFAEMEVGSDLEVKRETVRGRARTVLARAASINRATYSTLEQAIRSSAQLPGRKAVFFISDGFLLDPTNSNAPERMRQITDAAARTNAVIYSFDAKGLTAGFPEGTTGGTLIGYRVQSGERFEAQDGLSSLADETGGRFVKNTNDLQAGLKKSIDEAYQHYLLAWQPVSENEGSQKFRKIEVRIKGRPELKVRVHGGYFDKKATASSEETSATKNSATKNKDGKNIPLSVPDRELDAAVGALTPRRMLPTSLTVNYLNVTEKEMVVAVALQIKPDAVEFTPEKGEKATASIDLLGVIHDSKGIRKGFFRQLLTVETSVAALSKAERQDIYHDYQTKLTPGLYQVRVAARDVKSGRVGSAVQWVEIPDLTTKRMALSSLILGERLDDDKTNQEINQANTGGVRVRALVDRRISRTSHLQYMMFVYNASQGKTGTVPPDVTVQTQVLRGNQVVVTNLASQISTAGQDPSRLPYAAEISLNTLPAGKYALLVSVQDRLAKSNSAQRVSFEIK